MVILIKFPTRNLFRNNYYYSKLNFISRGTLLKKNWRKLLLIFFILLFLVIFIQSSLIRVISQEKPIIVGIDNSFPPMEWEEDGEVLGFDIDLMNDIADDMEREVVYIPLDWEDAYDAILNETVDCLFVTITPSRSIFMDFSIPILNDTSRIFVREDIFGISNIKDLENHTVAMEIDYSSPEYLINEVPEINPIYVNTTGEALALLENGDVFAYFGKYYVARYLIERNNIEGIKMIGDSVDMGACTIGVLKENTELLQAINNSIEVILNNGQYDMAYDKWFGTGLTKNSINQKTLQWLLISGILIAGAFIILFGWNYSLKRQVSIKTKALQKDIKKRETIENKLRETQEHLLHSQKMEAIGTFAGGIAHDFNNILTVINGTSNLMLDFIGDDQKEIKQDLQEIIDASNRATALTKQLLAFSRKQISQPQVIDVNNSLQQIRNMLQRLIGEDISLKIKYATDPTKIYIDPNQLTQIFMNLLVNARDAMPKGGTIKIQISIISDPYLEPKLKNILRSGCDYAWISIKDSGIGVDIKAREHIFEPFFTTKKKGAGTGLGLSTVYGIVKQHNGEITFSSKKHQGTQFDVYFPITDRSDEKSVLKETVSLEMIKEEKTVLIVEDEKAVRNFIINGLSSIGYKILAARDGSEALKISRNFEDTIHLMLTDVIMPGMSGKELNDIILQEHPDIKVLFMSGYAENIITSHGIVEKGINFIAKPFTIKELILKIKEILPTIRN